MSAAGRQRLPLVSSQRLMSALLRLGFVPDPNPSGGSHLSMYRQRPDGTKEVTVIILGKKEIPRGTLRNILKLGNISEAEFLLAAGKRRL